MAEPLLLIIDDEEGISSLCASIGKDAGFQVVCSSDFSEYKAIINTRKPDAILMDLVMPDKEGMELISWLSENKCQSKIILMSGYGMDFLEPAKLFATKHKLNYSFSLTKPFSSGELKSALENLL